MPKQKLYKLNLYKVAEYFINNKNCKIIIKELMLV